jgi:hypothetical protein
MESSCSKVGLGVLHEHALDVITKLDVSILAFCELRQAEVFESGSHSLNFIQ